MKIRFFILLVALLFLFFPRSAFAQYAYTIDNFDTKIEIQNSGEIKVVETINVEFNEHRHGIYRDIPYVYQDEAGNKTYTQVDVDKILQDDGHIESRETTDGQYLRIRIGDPDKTIYGKHKYTIIYSAKGILTSQAGFDELYWNTTGNNWDAPIASATATISNSKDAIISADCYQGATNSSEQCNTESTATEARFASSRPLSTYEGMTVAVGLKTGAFPITVMPRPKTFIEKLFSPFSIFSFLFMTIAGLSVIFLKWWKGGRDSWTPGITGMTGKNAIDLIKPIGAHEPVVVEYTPPENLTPALIGVLVDERADTLDVTATIIDLASRGFLTITEIPKKWLFGKSDYLLKETGKDTKHLLSYEKELLASLFTTKEIKTSDLRTTFYDDLARVKTKLYEEAIKRKYFPSNPESVRTKYLGAGVALVVFAFTVGFFCAQAGVIFGVDMALASFIVGVVVVVFSRFMPKRTAAGRELYRRIKGYRMFIDKAETYKQKYFENKNTFTDVLPYTIVFGLTEKFAKALDDMGVKAPNPSWYHSANTFSIMNFSSNVNDFSSSMSTAIASTPSSSGSGGGGFSGGGFGGGGGGSW